MLNFCTEQVLLLYFSDSFSEYGADQTARKCMHQSQVFLHRAPYMSLYNIYFKDHKSEFLNYDVFLSLKIVFTLSNIVKPDEMLNARRASRTSWKRNGFFIPKDNV